MALILFGGGVAEIRGSINGTTFARNKSGAYARNRTKPVNPNTVSQSANRARFAAQAAQWTSLTNAEQDSWIALAAGATRLNRLGQSYTPSGRQLFLESANNMELIGSPILTSAPLNSDIPAPPSYTGITLASTAGSPPTINAMDITGGAAVASFMTVVKAVPVNPGPKTNFSNLYRNLNPFATTATLSIDSAYSALFGTTAGVQGEPFSVLISNVDTATGFRSPELRLDANWPAPV